MPPEVEEPCPLPTIRTFLVVGAWAISRPPVVAMGGLVRCPQESGGEHLGVQTKAVEALATGLVEKGSDLPRD